MNAFLILFIILFVLAALAAAFFFRSFVVAKKTLEATQERIRGIVDADAELVRVQKETEQTRAKATSDIEASTQRARQEADGLRATAKADAARMQQEANQQRTTVLAAIRRETEQVSALQTQFTALQSAIKPLEEEATLMEFGFYKPLYDFPEASRYQIELDKVREKQKAMITGKTAATCAIQWTVDGSVTEGRKQTNQTLRLMLRAFNGECDAAIAKVRYNNVKVMEARIQKAYEAVNKLGETHRSSISNVYRQLKMDELHIAHEYQEKLQEEKEEQRRIREQMREEEIALREIEKAKEAAERDERRYGEALVKARNEVGQYVGKMQEKLMTQIADLERLLQEARANKERAIARAQQTRSGHVYVISNIGSFGENVYKLGLTRRLDPMDRIRELGDASVPFLFDVHAVIFSDDAPALEAKLHRHFHDRRVNRVNERREFFRVTLPEIAAAVKQLHGHIEFTHLAEAAEYRKTLSMGQAATQMQPVPVGLPLPVSAAASPASPTPPVVAPSTSADPTYQVQDAHGKWSPALSVEQIKGYITSGALPSHARVRNAQGREMPAAEDIILRAFFPSANSAPVAVAAPTQPTQVQAAQSTAISPQLKVCPECKTPAPLDAPRCTRCGHAYRTQFAPQYDLS